MTVPTPHWATVRIETENPHTALAQGWQMSIQNIIYTMTIIITLYDYFYLLLLSSLLFFLKQNEKQ